MDTGYSLEDLPEVVDDGDEWQERIKEFCARNMTYNDNDEFKWVNAITDPK